MVAMLGSFSSSFGSVPALCKSESKLRRPGSSWDLLLPLAVTARGEPKLCDEATLVTAT